MWANYWAARERDMEVPIRSLATSDADGAGVDAEVGVGDSEPQGPVASDGSQMSGGEARAT